MSKTRDAFGFAKAFEDLKRAEACPSHVWSKPQRTEWKEGKRLKESYDVRCTRCGARYGRSTLRRLRDEVLNA